MVSWLDRTRLIRRYSPDCSESGVLLRTSERTKYSNREYTRIRRRTVLSIGATVVTTVIAGCSGSETGTPGPVEAADDSPGATTSLTLRVEVDEALGGEEWTRVGAMYSQDGFTVKESSPDDVGLGVDNTWDGELDERFDDSHISHITTDNHSFDVRLESDYLLAEGDFVVVDYPDIKLPTDPGDYTVEVTLNGGQTDRVTIEIE